MSSTGRPRSATVRSAIAPAIRTSRVKAPKTHSRVVHGANVSSTPESTIAREGPRVVIAAMMPMFSPSFSRGETASVMFMPIGVSRPVPMAWSRRAISSTSKDGARAPIIEPMTMTATTETNNCRVGKRWYSTFETGTNTAATSRYPVVSHCTVFTSTPKSFMIGVKATLRKASLKVARNAAAAATAIIQPARPGTGAGAVWDEDKESPDVRRVGLIDRAVSEGPCVDPRVSCHRCLSTAVKPTNEAITIPRRRVSASG